MKKIYSENGLISVKRIGDRYFFFNQKTGMSLSLHKIDIETFYKFNGYNYGCFCRGKSYGNFIRDGELKSIKSYLKLKNKKLTKLSSIIKYGENIKNVVNILKSDELIDYVERNKLWKNL